MNLIENIIEFEKYQILIQICMHNAKWSFWSQAAKQKMTMQIAN